EFKSELHQVNLLDSYKKGNFLGSRGLPPRNISELCRLVLARRAAGERQSESEARSVARTERRCFREGSFRDPKTNQPIN
ncbi:MAG: hypothetical protein Q8L24_02355, partial [bacterium]|nr:hypothetical protein [bacterium]